MAVPEQDLLLVRLAVHYRVLDENAGRALVTAFSERGGGATLAAFMVSEGTVDATTLQKLEKARAVYLQQKAGAGAATGAAASTAGPVSAAAGPATPAAPAAPAAPEAPEASAAPAAPAPSPTAELVTNGSLEDLLREAVRRGASDLHVHSGAPLRMRLDGHLSEVDAYEITSERAQELVNGLLNQGQLELLEENLQLDLMYEIKGIARFRGNIYQQQRGIDAVFRVIPFIVPSLAELSLPESIGKLAEYHQGLVLFTGPTGCGKSSTMAAVIDQISRDRREHILTIEEPVEFIFEGHQALINQRHVGPHTESFSRALRAALREDPDVIVIGELRDLESISLALTAAETGHLVLATLHTTGALRTINRLLGVFPPDEQPQVRAMLSESLRAIVSQHLVPKIGGGRVPALELLMNTPAIANLIRDQKTFQIRSVMQTSTAAGMCLLDASLTAMVRAGTVTLEDARRFSDEPEKLEPGK